MSSSNRVTTVSSGRARCTPGPARGGIFRLIAVPEHIAQARTIEGLCPALPWSSFADFFTSRIVDRNLSHRPYLIYRDEDSAAHRTYTYAQFGSVVRETAAFLRDDAGLRRG